MFNSYDPRHPATGGINRDWFRYWRVKGATVAEAARVSRGRADKPHAAFSRDSLASYQNAPTDRGGRWIERPDLAGLRFVGFADELAGLQHYGYFTEEDGDGEVNRGCVYALPSRHGLCHFVEAYQVGSSDRRGHNFTDTATGTRDDSMRPAVVFLADRHLGSPGGYQHDADSSDACRSAAIGANREAELAAESEREWREANAAGIRCAEYAAEAVEGRKAARELVRAFRADLASRGRPAPAICAMMRDAIRREIRNASKAATNAAKLADDWGGFAGTWRAHLTVAFNEGRADA